MSCLVEDAFGNVLTCGLPSLMWDPDSAIRTARSLAESREESVYLWEGEEMLIVTPEGEVL